MYRPILKNETIIRVRFNEVDSMGIVWHGSYVSILEEGRESFGKEFGLGYLDIHSNGCFAPLVKMNIDYKQAVQYGDSLRIVTCYEYTPAARIHFTYSIYRESDGVLAATADTIQVFTDTEGELILTCPDFFETWKRKWEQIKPE